MARKRGVIALGVGVNRLVIAFGSRENYWTSTAAVHVTTRASPPPPSRQRRFRRGGGGGGFSGAGDFGSAYMGGAYSGGEGHACGGPGYYVPTNERFHRGRGGWGGREGRGDGSSRDLAVFRIYSYQEWVWKREAHINWSVMICQGSTRSELP